MIRLPNAAWRLLVERQTGLTQSSAISRRRGSQVWALLERHAVEPGAPDEATATVAAALAFNLYRLKPLRRWYGVGRAQAVIAAASAIELLRLAGWSFTPGAINAVADALGRGESRAGIVRHLCASGTAPSSEQLNAEVYLSAQVSGRNANAARLIERWTPIIEEALEEGGRDIGVDLFLRAPGGTTNQPERLIKTVRCGLQHAVLHFVIGVRGGSVGIGREIDASIARRRPVIWLEPQDDRTPISVIATANEANLVIVPIPSIDELSSSVKAQVKLNATAIRALLRERDSVPVALLELQEHLRRRWIRIPATELAPLLQTARITPRRAAVLLTEPFVMFHEASVSELDALSSILGMDVLAERQDAIRRAIGL